jgi:rod shape determining protein RodA
MLRPYAAARRTLSIADKLYEINWGLVLLITIIAAIGFAMQYSVAGGSWDPWAGKQLVRFVVGFVIMIVVAMVDIRVWMNFAYPFYAFSLLLLLGVELMGMAHLGAQRWITLGPLELQPSEPMKIAVILALAKFLHGQSVEDISNPLRLIIPLTMIAMPAV